MRKVSECVRTAAKSRPASASRPVRRAAHRPWNPGVLQKSATVPRTDGLRAAARCSGRTARADAGCPRRWAGSQWRCRCDRCRARPRSRRAAAAPPPASRRAPRAAAVAISSGRKRDSPMSLRCIRKVLRACNGSNTSDSFRASSSVASALCTACARRSARGVGATPPPERTNSASPSRAAQPRQALARGGLRQVQRSAARLTLRVRQTASKRRNRLRSRSLIFIQCMSLIQFIVLMDRSTGRKLGATTRSNAWKFHSARKSNPCAWARARPFMARASWPSPRAAAVGRGLCGRLPGGAGVAPDGRAGAGQGLHGRTRRACGGLFQRSVCGRDARRVHPLPAARRGDLEVHRRHQRGSRRPEQPVVAGCEGRRAGGGGRGLRRGRQRDPGAHACLRAQVRHDFAGPAPRSRPHGGPGRARLCASAKPATCPR
jgi:hypothetical protein